MRFVDLVESNTQFFITFRNAPSQTVASGTTDTLIIGSKLEFSGARAGSRHFRIFLSDTLQSIASTVIVDSTVNLVADHNYTFILWGNGRSPKGAADAMHLSVLDEAPADPGTSVALRVINATSAGLTGDVTLPWPAGLFRPHAFAYDMIYADAPTTFLRWAGAQGVQRSADGLGMLIEQAAESFYLWRGVRPDTAPVFSLLRPSR